MRHESGIDAATAARLLRLRIRHQRNNPKGRASIIAASSGIRMDKKVQAAEAASSTTLTMEFPIPPVPAVINGLDDASAACTLSATRRPQIMAVPR
jgi:hypothetical protein